MSKKHDGLYFSFQEIFNEPRDTCSLEEQAFLYFQGILPEKDIPEFEQHLSGCASCGFLLAGLREAEEMGTVALDSSRTDRLLTETREKLQALVRDKYPVSQPRPAGKIDAAGRFFGTSSMRGYVNAIFIVLLALLIYPSYRGFVLDKQVAELQNELTTEKSRKIVAQEDLTRMKETYEQDIGRLKEEQHQLLEPSATPPEIYHVRLERAGEATVIPIRFSETRQHFSLLFSVPTPEFKRFLVEIFEKDRLIWHADFEPGNLVANPSPSLISVSLHSRYFQEGSYRLRISGQDRNTTTLSEYKLLIHHE